MPGRDTSWLPDRLAAVDAVARAERDVEQAVEQAVRRWLAACRRLILGDDSGPVLAAGEPPNLDAVTAAQPEWEAALEELVRPALEALFGERFAAIARIAEISDQPYRERHLELVMSRLQLFPASAWEEIRPELLEALSQGEDIEAVRRRISAILDFDTTPGAAGEQEASRAIQARINQIENELEKDLDAAERAALRAERAGLYEDLHRADRAWQWKARRIARTETMSALNAGTHAGALVRQDALGVTLVKEWVATHDLRVRPDHARADGQLRRVGDSFQVGGWSLAFPGDPLAPGSQTINCRCTTILHDEEDLDDAQRAQLSERAPDGPVSASGGHMNEQQGELPNGWRGVMGPLDIQTGDGRILATPPDGLRTREGTIVLMWQETTAAGHDGSVLVGRADRVWTETVDGVDVVMGEGPIDLGGEHGREAARLMKEGLLTGVSIDPDDYTISWQWRDKAGNAVDVDELPEDEFWDLYESGEIVEVMVMTDWRLMGGTLVTFPAFDQARIEPLYDYEPAGGDDQGDGGDSDDGDGGGVAASAAVEVPVYEAADFADPGLDGPTPLTVTEDGRVYGHLATWRQPDGSPTCHIGYPDACISPPKSQTSYAYFHVGAVRLADGSSLPVGTITLGTGHAEPGAGYRAAVEHYDNTGTAVAAVRAGEDGHGIWVSGRLLGDVTPGQVEDLMRSPLSGDWRRIGGNLELVAALCVNTPGFPVPRRQLAASAAGQQSLVAAGWVRRRGRRRRPDGASAIDYAKLARLIAQEAAGYAARSQRAAQLARRIGRDPASRVAAAAARIGR